MADDLRFEHRMSDSDALMWTIEKDPMLRSTIVAVAALDRAPDHRALAERLERASRLVPRLRQRVVGNPFSLAPPRWEVDPHFDLRYHLRWLRTPAGGDLDQALHLVEPIAMQGFDRARPLWEFYVIEGLADDGAVVALKLHHAITDGVGAVKIGMVLFDLEREPSQPLPEMPDAPAVHVLHMRERTLDALDHERRRQLGIAKRTPATLARAARRLASDPGGALRTVRETASSAARMLAPSPTPLGPVMRGRSLSVQFDTISLPLEDAKAAAKVAHGKLNDAFVAAMLGGLRRYHDHHGAPVNELRMT
ncbi:MAG TPA: wax ester/triacylglycerol synthase domain-containing protein, partial [Acidimicrobiales bacterium]|nr:wax ester/triacylglycerol synthase domain-containing protein [Acidimicrobiales bacterium]